MSIMPHLQLKPFTRTLPFNFEVAEINGGKIKISFTHEKTDHNLDM